MTKKLTNLIKKALVGLGLVGTIGVNAPACITYTPGRSYVPQSYFPEERKKIRTSGKGEQLLKRLNEILADYCDVHYATESGFRCYDQYDYGGYNEVELAWKDVERAKLVQLGDGCTTIAINRSWWSGKDIPCVTGGFNKKGIAKAQECIDLILTLRDIYGR